MPATKTPVSGYRSHVRVEMSDGTELDIQTKLTDVLRWEKANNGQGWMQFPMPLERQMWVLYYAARRLKLTDSTDPDGWMAQIVDFEDVPDPVLDEEEQAEADGRVDVDPTTPTSTSSATASAS